VSGSLRMAGEGCRSKHATVRFFHLATTLAVAGGFVSKVAGTRGASPADGFPAMALARPWRRASTAAPMKALKCWSSIRPAFGGSVSGRTPAAEDSGGIWSVRVPRS
jgi:hypothetical protein